MHIYLPIAEISVNVIYIILVGIFSGMISGLFSIGGSFLGIPILVAYGLESSTVVSSFTNQMMTTSFISLTDDIRQKKINFRIVFITFIGGFFGVLLGIYLFKKLTNNGYIEIVISFLYIFVLGFIAIFMFIDGFHALRRKYSQNQIIHDSKKQNHKDEKNTILSTIDIFPYKIEINNVKISVFMIIFFGFIAGLLVAVGGVASGLIMIPVMTYIYKMHIRHAMASSGLNGGMLVFFSNIMQIITIKKTDVILSFLLLIGTVIGIIITKKFADKMPPDEIRFGLSILMIVIVMKIVLNITLEPKDIFVISSIN